MLEINVKITVDAGKEYTPTELAVIQALQGTTKATVAPKAAAAPVAAPAAAAEAKATEAPAEAPAPKAPAKKAPVKRTPAAAKPSTTQAAVLEDEPEAEAEAEAEAEDDLVGGGADAEETTYTVEDAVTQATKTIKLKDGRAKLKTALSAANAVGDTAYKMVSEMGEDAPAIQAFMAALKEA